MYIYLFDQQTKHLSDGENVKLVFYWSNDHQHLADVALRGFGGGGRGQGGQRGGEGGGERGETEECSSVDSSDFAALQEWLVFGDSVSMAKKASDLFEVSLLLSLFFSLLSPSYSIS